MSDDRPTYGPPITIPSVEFLGRIAYDTWFAADHGTDDEGHRWVPVEP
jgi:hypothetical protein